MKVTGKGEYGELIRHYFQGSFPEIAVKKGKDLLNILTDVLVGSKDLRYGPLPSPEALVTIRKTIQKAIEFGEPIPILVPWGGRKMDKNLSLDIAEISGLKQLLRVDECVRKSYAPGLLIRVRIEDINAEWLYNDQQGIQEYSEGMTKLIGMIKGNTKIIGVLESQMMGRMDYFRKANEYSPLLQRVLESKRLYPTVETKDILAYQELISRGWVGEIPQEQREYYIGRYRKLYPNQSEEVYEKLLADYFAGSKARYDLNGRGDPKTEVGSFIQINFAHPVPGAPATIFNNTLYYRTIPACLTRTHIAPWRAKGYLSVIGDIVTPKIVFPGQDLEELVMNSTRLSKEDDSEALIVSTDYRYEDDLSPYLMPIPLM